VESKGLSLVLMTITDSAASVPTCQSDRGEAESRACGRRGRGAGPGLRSGARALRGVHFIGKTRLDRFLCPEYSLNRETR